jgi:hypothetical protein
VFVLFVEIPSRVSIEVLPASLFAACDLGSSPGFASFQDEVELGRRTGNNRHSIDASGLEQRSSSLVGTVTVDSKLGIVLAGVVSARDRMASEIKSWIGRQRRPVERASGTTNRNVVEAKTSQPASWTREMLAKEGKTWRVSSPYP